MTKDEVLQAWRRGLESPGMPGAPGAPGGALGVEDAVEGPGVLGKALDYASRPVSGVMGGFFGALSPELTVGEGIGQGLRGERYFSAYDFLVEGGADPDATSTKLLGLGADILNPADPLNYVGLGWTKAGKVAKGLTAAGGVSSQFGKVASRADAAAKGLWSPLTFAGHGLVPKAASLPVARALDAAGARVTKSRFVTALAPYLGGVKKFEKEFGGVSSMLGKGKRALRMSEEEFAAEMMAMEGKLVAEFGPEEGRRAMADVQSLLERPEVRLARVERELELVEQGMAGQFAEWLPAGIPADEAEAVTRVSFANQRAVDRKVAELEVARRLAAPGAIETVGDVTPPAPPQAGGYAMEDDIIERYLGRSGGKVETRVRLADLRKGVPEYARGEMDAALLRMQQEGKLVLYRLDDPQDTFDADRAAALMLGNDPRHLVYLKPEAVTAAEARAAAPRAIETAPAPGSREALDELHVLKSVQVARFASDMPPMDVLAKERERLAGEASKIRALWDEAGPADRSAYALASEKRQAIFDLYLEPLRKLDGDVEMPVEDYMKHLFPAAYASLPKNVLKARAAVAAEREALVLQLAGEGLDDAAIAREVKARMGAKLGVLQGSNDKGLLTGELDAFKSRQYDMSIDEFNAWATAEGKEMRFETHTAAILSAMHRDASRWRFGFDLHKFILDKPGWTLSGEDYAKLSKVEQKAWSPMEFHVPWIKGEKDPFKGRYMRAEVKALAGSQLKGMEQLLTDDGLNGVLGALSTFREWWTAWTLAPFPSTRVRDLVSDMVLAHQAGLNPALDLAKAPLGESMYMASMALNARRSKVPSIRGMAGNAPANLTGVLERVRSKFPELTEEKLVEYMEIENVLGMSAVRDLDIDALLSNDALMKDARGKRGAGRKMAGFFHPDPKKSPIIKTGFKVAQTTADFTRGALFLDTLVKALPQAERLEDALTHATAVVRKFQFDYTDLTKTERELLKNIIPFYTFSAKNIPLQITQAATDPGRMQWVNRLYQGAWGQFEEEEIKPEDLPEWLADGLGMPISAVTLEDGTPSYAIWTPRGWLPQTELNEMADIIRGKAGSAILSRLNPLLKEPFEQLLNRDAFTMRDIEDGTIRDVMGIPMNRRAAHLVNNVRLVTEVDRIDPGGLWTKIGQQMGWWEDERPHRWTAPGPERATRFLTGLNIKGVAPVEQAERNVRDADREANAALSRARYALRRGQTLEAEKFMESVAALRTEKAAAMARWNELRRRNALDVARREKG